MDVNQVRFGNYSIGNSNAQPKKSKEKPEEEVSKELKKEEFKGFSAEETLGALETQGIQNFAQINMVSKKEINPANYLSEERIADIEAMMEGFDSGVNKIASVLEEELPMLSASNRQALAARMFAQG